MSSSPAPHIAIIGAGFSGTLTAVHLLRADPTGACRVTLIERTGRFGPGLAYSTPSPVHFLNVPAGNMSAFDDDPGHFLRWARERDDSVQTGSFLPRGVYGQYLKSLLAPELNRRVVGADQPRLQQIVGEAIAIEDPSRGTPVVRLSSGERLEADRAVLALGNSLPAHPSVPDNGFANHAAYIHNPWDTARLDRILPDEPVLIIGTGLTMMDVVMSLHARDHAGRVLAISRHGLLPRPHRSPSRPPLHRDPPAGLKAWNGSARGLMRLMRQAVCESAGRGTDWRDVVTSVRAITPDLWRRMPGVERERFLCRMRSYWDVARHRAAPETAAAVADLIAARRLSIRAARLISLEPRGNLLEATFRPRGSSIEQSIRVGKVVNCLGPDTDIRRCPDRLIQQLLATGRITADPHALGIDVSDDGVAIGRDGRPNPLLLVIGPVRRAQLWENTAVPELRRQAAHIAHTALAGLKPAVTIAAGAPRAPVTPTPAGSGSAP